jgi:hypothetical protein
MAQLSTKLRIMSLVLALTIISLGDLYGADWKLLSNSRRGRYYYDKGSITRPANDIVRVLVAYYPSEELIPEFELLFGERYADLSYWYESVEIHCRRGISRVTFQESYSGNGAFIGSIYNRLPTPWYEIKKWHIGHSRLLEELCK